MHQIRHGISRRFYVRFFKISSTEQVFFEASSRETWRTQLIHVDCIRKLNRHLSRVSREDVKPYLRFQRDKTERSKKFLSRSSFILERISNDDGNPEDNAWKKMNLSFTFEFHN